MANTIRIKRGVGKPDSLLDGELAIDTSTGRLYSLVGGVVTELNEPPEGVDLSDYIDKTKRNDVVEGSFQIVWDDSADDTYPFNGRIGYNSNESDPNALDGSFLYVNGTRGTFSIGRDGDIELHGASEIQGVEDGLTGERPWITGFSYVQAADFLDEDGNSIVGGDVDLSGYLKSEDEYEIDFDATGATYDVVSWSFDDTDDGVDGDFKISWGKRRYDDINFIFRGHWLHSTTGLNLHCDSDNGESFQHFSKFGQVFSYASRDFQFLTPEVVLADEKGNSTDADAVVKLKRDGASVFKHAVQAADFLDADGNSIIGAGGGGGGDCDGKYLPAEFYPEYTWSQGEVSWTKYDVWKTENLAADYLYSPRIHVTSSYFYEQIDARMGLSASLAGGKVEAFRAAFVEVNAAGGINILASAEDLPLSIDEDEIEEVEKKAKSIQNALTVTHRTLGRTVEIDKEGIIRANQFTDMDGNPIGGDVDGLDSVSPNVFVGSLAEDSPNRGDQLTTLGHYNKVDRVGGTAVGYGAQALGDQGCTAIGWDSRANHIGASAFGSSTQALHFYGIALGKEAATTKDYEFAISPYTTSVNFSGATVQAKDFLDADGNSIIGAGGGGGGDVDLTGYATETWVSANYQVKGNYLTSSSLNGYATETWVGQNYEPKFTKNTAFNKSFGTSSNTVAQGNHNHSGVYEPVFSKNTAFNKNFGTSSTTVAYGNHTHNGVYAPVSHTHSNYAAVGASYTKSESDARYEAKGASGFDGNYSSSSPAKFTMTGGDGSSFWVYAPSNARGAEIHLQSGSNNQYFRCGASGSFEIVNSAYSAVTFYVTNSGTTVATGDVTAFSDVRLKENIETLDGSKVYQMRGVSFTKDGRDGSGVIAQELKEVAPELVNDDGEYLSVAYGNLVGYLIEAVKELKAEVEELKRG